MRGSCTRLRTCTAARLRPACPPWAPCTLRRSALKMLLAVDLSGLKPQQGCLTPGITNRPTSLKAPRKLPPIDKCAAQPCNLLAAAQRFNQKLRIHAHALLLLYGWLFCVESIGQAPTAASAARRSRPARARARRRTATTWPGRPAGCTRPHARRATCATRTPRSPSLGARSRSGAPPPVARPAHGSRSAARGVLCWAPRLTCRRAGVAGDRSAELHAFHQVPSGLTGLPKFEACGAAASVGPRPPGAQVDVLRLQLGQHAVERADAAGARVGRRGRRRGRARLPGALAPGPRGARARPQGLRPCAPLAALAAARCH